MGSPRSHVGLTGHACAFPTHSEMPQANVPSTVHAPHAHRLQPRSLHGGGSAGVLATSFYGPRQPSPEAKHGFRFNCWAFRKQTHRHGNHLTKFPRENLMMGKVGYALRLRCSAQGG